MGQFMEETQINVKEVLSIPRITFSSIARLLTTRKSSNVNSACPRSISVFLHSSMLLSTRATSTSSCVTNKCSCMKTTGQHKMKERHLSLSSSIWLSSIFKAWERWTNVQLINHNGGRTWKSPDKRTWNSERSNFHHPEPALLQHRSVPISVTINKNMTLPGPC